MAASKLIGEKMGSRRSEADADGTRRYAITYLVLAASIDVLDDKIAVTPRLPRFGSRHALHPYAFVKSVAPRRVADSNELWEVDVTWEATPGQREDDTTKAPWDRPPKIRFDEVRAEESRRKDIAGKPFVNTAGDPLVDRPRILRSDTMITITRAELEYDEIEAMSWGNKANSDTWRGYPKYAALMHMPTADNAYYSDDKVSSQEYWNITYRIWVLASAFDEVDPVFWIPTYVLNQGPRCLRKVTAADGSQSWKREFCEDDNGVASTEHFLLDVDGTQMSRDRVNDVGEWWLEFQVVGERQFHDLLPGV